MRVVKITSPVWLGTIAPRIADFYKKIEAHPSVTYESLYTFFTRVIQFGKGNAEFHVAVNEEGTPEGFAMWSVTSLPAIGAVTCDYIYTWSRKKDTMKALIMQFKQFGLKHRAPFSIWKLRSDAVVRLAQAFLEKNEATGVSFEDRKTIIYNTASLKGEPNDG